MLLQAQYLIFGDHYLHPKARTTPHHQLYLSLTPMASSVFNGPVAPLQDNTNASQPPPQDGPSTGLSAATEQPPRVGMSFDSMADAKKYITEWCARERIPYSVWKADRRCWVLTCKDKTNCLFRLRVKNVDRPIISILEAHTCSSLSFRRTAQTGGPIKATPYNWPHDASLGPQTTALVLIDMQRDCAASYPLLSANDC